MLYVSRKDMDDSRSYSYTLEKLQSMIDVE
jgi:hypothetical protein